MYTHSLNDARRRKVTAAAIEHIQRRHPFRTRREARRRRNRVCSGPPRTSRATRRRSAPKATASAVAYSRQARATQPGMRTALDSWCSVKPAVGVCKSRGSQSRRSRWEKARSFRPTSSTGMVRHRTEQFTMVYIAIGASKISRGEPVTDACTQAENNKPDQENLQRTVR